METERPHIKLTTLDNVLEVITYIALVIATVLIFILRAEGYKYSGVLIYLFLILIIIGGFDLLQKRNVYPRVFNAYFALNGHTFDIATQSILYKVILRMFRWITTLLCLLFAYNIAYELISIGQRLKIDIPFWLFIVSILFCLIFYLSKAMKIIRAHKDE